jgi:hypothetical protein
LLLDATHVKAIYIIPNWRMKLATGKSKNK